MPKRIVPLSNTKVRLAKAKDKPQKLFDGGGLFLLVTPTTIRRLELCIFPWLRARQIKTITAPELLAALRRIGAKGAFETAHRVKQVCGQVFRYAVATGRAKRDPSGNLRGATPPASGKHMATITGPKEIVGLLRSIDDYRGSIVTQYALQLAPLK